MRSFQYNAHFDWAISIDEMGLVEYWSGYKGDYKFPDNVQFEYKTDTDLYEFAKVWGGGVANQDFVELGNFLNLFFKVDRPFFSIDEPLPITVASSFH